MRFAFNFAMFRQVACLQGLLVECNGPIVSLGQVCRSCEDLLGREADPGKSGNSGSGIMTGCWLPSKPKITLANLAKVDKFLLANYIFF